MFDLRFLCGEAFWLLLVLGLSITFWNFLDTLWSQLVHSKYVKTFDLFGGDSLQIFVALNIFGTIAFPDFRTYLAFIYFVVDLICIIVPRYLIYKNVLNSQTDNLYSNHSQLLNSAE